MPSPKRLLQSLLPPVIWNAGKAIKRSLSTSVDDFVYAPDGWSTPLPNASSSDYWAAFIDQERAAFNDLRTRVDSAAPQLSADGAEEIKYLLFAYVLALVGARKARADVLDYGGNLGDYDLVARALVPGVEWSYHVKELAPIAAAGRDINPAVTFHTSDECFDRAYDIVVFSSSLHCVPEWRDVLERAATAATEFLLVSGVAVVRSVPGFVAIQRSRGVANLQHMLNRDDIVNLVEGRGLRLFREIVMRPHPIVRGAPEQPTDIGLVFRRSTNASDR